MFSSRSLAIKLIAPRYIRFMAQSIGKGGSKKFILVDISSDTVCPWCLVGKRNLEKVMASSQDQFDFEVRWHPFLLNPHLTKEGVVKKDHFKKKFGPRYESVLGDWVEVFREHGLDYNLSGLTGNIMDSHRLIAYVGTQGLDKQNALVEELLLDIEYLVETANKVGVEGATKFLKDPNNGVEEVHEEFEKYSRGITWVPHFVINGKLAFSGDQSPEVFLRAFQEAAQYSD